MTNPTLEDLSEPVTPSRADWNNEGVVVLEGLLPDDLIDAYVHEWCEANGFVGIDFDVDGPTSQPGVLNAARPGGWPHCTPYRENPALRALCCYSPLAKTIEYLIGEPAGVHLNLTGWVTTARRWHQDTYLNPWHVGDHYAAVWMALGDVQPDSGPFEYIPGSHLWHRLTRDRIAPHVDLRDPNWPRHTEAILTGLVEAEATSRSADINVYLPKRGDVLIWHPRLYHQGSPARVPGAYRPSLIAHYSGIYHRQDMPAPVHVADNGTESPSYKPGLGSGGWYFPVDGGPV